MENAWSEGISDAPRETPSGRPPPWTTGTSSRPPPTRHSPTPGRSTTGPPPRHPRRWPRWPRSTSRSPRPAAIRPTRCGCSPTWAPRPPSRSTGGRYFGFVTGATYPVALGSAWLAAAWDQNAALPVMSPVAARLHEVVRRWLRRPAAAARGHGAGVRHRRHRGQRLLPGRRPRRAARPAGLGRPGRRAVRRAAAHGGDRRARALDAVQVARAGRARPHAGARRARRRPGPAARRAAARRGGPGAGLRTGRRGQHRRVRPVRRRSPTGLAERGRLAARRRRVRAVGAGRPDAAPQLVAGLDRADSWATDGHKWLNVTYDCGIAFVRELADLRRTFAAVAGYLPASDASSRRCTTRRSRRSGPGRSRCGRCCARSAATASPSWSAGACDAAAAIADRLRAGGLDGAQRRRAQPGAGPARRRPHHRGARSPRSRPTAGSGAARRSGTGAPRDADQRVVVEDRARRAAEAVEAILECAAQARKSASRT